MSVLPSVFLSGLFCRSLMRGRKVFISGWLRGKHGGGNGQSSGSRRQCGNCAEVGLNNVESTSGEIEALERGRETEGRNPSCLCCVDVDMHWYIYKYTIHSKVLGTACSCCCWIEVFTLCSAGAKLSQYLHTTAVDSTLNVTLPTLFIVNT